MSFLLENAVFLLIGLQLPGLLRALGIDDLSPTTIAAAAVGVYLTTVVARFVWVYATALVPRTFTDIQTDPRERVVISWAGMRGVVTLAAALTLPETVPNRDVLVFIAFFVVVASLLVQGLSLPWLVRRLKLPPPDQAALALEEAALLDHATKAGAMRLDEVAQDTDPDDVRARLRARTEDRRNAAWERVARPGSAETPVETYSRLRMQMLQAERRAVLDARDADGYSDEVIRRVIRLMDVEEGMLDMGRDPDGAERDDLIAPANIAGACAHLAAAGDLARPQEPVQCAGCLLDGTQWVHLRMCLTCGYVGCCDSSERRHAEGHFQETGHPVMRSVEPGEAWRWCYVDELLGT